MSEQNSSIVRYEWLVNYPGYRVGSDGTVWSCLVSRPASNSRVYNYSRWKELKQMYQEKSGKYYAVISRVNGKRANKYVHSLILEGFVGPRPPGLEGCHENGVGTDNRIGNLRWGTSQSNKNDMIRHGTSTRGEKNPKAKLNWSAVMEIRSLVASGLKPTEIAKKYGIHRNSVYNVCSKYWNSGG